MNRNNNNNNNNNSSLKPEYVLKRVNDLINSAVGNNEKEKRFALEQLHSVIGVKRKGVWTKVYESLMKRHLELCVDLKDHHTAKDGLHQYRNLCQSVDPNSLEVVILYLMELSEERATAARQKADKVSLAAAARVSDLDQEETPESIMLSSMTEEGAKDRTDREVVVPWLKFLWENYRAILELLYKLPKLEKTYHKTCEKAFKFCLDYSRIMEFRRLCEMLRQQLSNLQKTPVAGNQRNARPQWEWTTEAIDFHLQTRFSQLEVATTLELWNEGFRTVEDIYAIIVSSKKQPKAKLMVTYYEKLTRIFWVSDNKLFHAYAWYRYYCLCCDTRKDLKTEDKTLLASSVLLAALTIPSIKDIYSAIVVDDDEVVVEKNSQMALLLDFQSQPSRQALLNDIVNRGLLSEVLPELAKLFECLEAKFQPTSLVKNISAAVAAIKSYPTLNAYSLPLQRIIVIKVMQQLSRVYKTVRIEFVNKLLSGLSDLSANQIEKIVIEGVSSKQLNLKINHSNGSIEFAAAVASAAAVDVQVSQLGAQLNRVANTITDALGSSTLAEQRAASRREFLNTVLEAAEEEYSASVDRKALIERRKEGLERLQLEKQKEEKRVKDVEEARRKKEEDERLIKEELARAQEKKKKLNEKLELTRVQKELEKHGVVMEESAIAELDAVARRALIMDAQSESQKAKEDETRRMTEQARRLDHITRALRIEGATAIAAKYAAQVEEDKKIHAAREVERQTALKEQHATDVAEKQRLARMQAHRRLFEEALLKKQKADYEKKIAKMRVAAINERRDQNIARARRLLHEELERQEEEEERQREAEAKIERDRIEREQAETLRKQRQADEARESELENMRKQIAQAENKGSSAGAAAGGAGGYRPPSQRAGPSSGFGSGAPQSSNSRFGGPSSSSTPQKSDSEGGWRRAAPAAAPAPSAAPAAASNAEKSFGFGPSTGGSSGGRWVSERAKQAEASAGGAAAPAGGAGSAAPKPTSDWKRSGPGDNKDAKPAPTRARW